MIKHLTRLLFWLPRRVVSVVLEILERRETRIRTEPLNQKWHWTARLSATARRFWRAWARAIKVAVGLGLFLGLQYALALAINREEWYLVGAMLVGGVCMAAVFARPSFAFVAWLIVSPVAGIYLRLEKIGDLPQITFDRVVIYSLAMMLLVRALVRKEKPRKLILPEWFFLLFPLYVLATIPFFPHEAPQREMLIFMQRAGDPVLIYLIAKTIMSERKYVGAVIAGLLTVGAYSSAMAMYDHFTGRMSLAALSGIEASLYYADAGGRAAGPFLSPMDLGIMLGLAIPLAVLYSEWTKRTGARIFYYLCIPVMAASCFFTYTRGAYLVLIGTMLLMPLLASRCRKRFFMALMVFVVIAMIGVPVVMMDKGVEYRLTQDRTALQRVTLARTMMNLIKANPWFGVGLDNHSAEMSHYIADSPRARRDIWYGGNASSLPIMTASHNAYLTIMSDHGLVGFFLFLGSYIGFGIYIWRSRKFLKADDLLGRDLASVVMAAMIGYLLSRQTTGLGTGYVSYIIWILIAVVVRLVQISNEEALERKAGLAAPRQKELAV